MKVTEIKIGCKRYTPTKTNSRYQKCNCNGCAFQNTTELCKDVNSLCGAMPQTKVWEEKK